MYDPIPGEPPEPSTEERTKRPAQVRLQEEGVYPAAFSAITRESSLEPYIPHLEYREWEQCGHEPWREKAVRDDFFAELREWLNRHSA